MTDCRPDGIISSQPEGVGHATRCDAFDCGGSFSVRHLCRRSALGRFPDPPEDASAVHAATAALLILHFCQDGARKRSPVNDIVRRYARLQVPRYTSYPTAAEFTPAVGAIDQSRWLRGLDGSEPVSLYLHVPYCRELCLYCGCNTKKALRDDVIGGYREALEREIALVGETASGPMQARMRSPAAALGRGNPKHPR